MDAVTDARSDLGELAKDLWGEATSRLAQLAKDDPKCTPIVAAPAVAVLATAGTLGVVVAANEAVILVFGQQESIATCPG